MNSVSLCNLDSKLQKSMNFPVFKKPLLQLDRFRKKQILVEAGFANGISEQAKQRGVNRYRVKPDVETI